MKSAYYIFLIFFCVLSFISCKKNQLGGKSQIKGTVMHHARYIAYSRVFVKFNATEFPGEDTTKYDAKVWTDSKGAYSIKCYKGNYYLYGFGYDNLAIAFVKGGIPIKIRDNEALETDVAVTE